MSNIIDPLRQTEIFTRYWKLLKRLWVSYNLHGRYPPSHDEAYLVIPSLGQVDRIMAREDYQWDQQNAIASLQVQERLYMAIFLCQKSWEACPVQRRRRSLLELSAQHQERGSWLKRMHE